MANPAKTPELAPEIRAHYDAFGEVERLTSGSSRLELARTQEILLQNLPQPPALVLDVGGGPGVYSLWLAGLGYEVHLLDAVQLHVDQASEGSRQAPRPIASCRLGDARTLPWEAGSADAVLLLGPLYHLVERPDRLRALGESLRVLKPGGRLFAAAISRFASLLDGIARDLFADPRFPAIVERDLREGVHRNDTDRIDFFTTAFFHHPDELEAEVAEAGFAGVEVLGIEGPGWILPDFEERWQDPRRREDLLRAARAVECEPSIRGLSAHLLAAGRKPEGKESDLSRRSPRRASCSERRANRSPRRACHSPRRASHLERRASASPSRANCSDERASRLPRRAGLLERRASRSERRASASPWRACCSPWRARCSEDRPRGLSSVSRERAQAAGRRPGREADKSMRPEGHQSSAADRA
jgi:SAM-dependent methyltransferase